MNRVYYGVFIAAAVLVAACGGGGSSTPPVDSTSAPKTSPSSSTSPSPSPSPTSTAMTQTVYVVDRNDNALLEWGPASGYGNVAATATISGSNTEIGAPMGLAVDGSGKIYTSDDSADSIAIFSAGAQGNATPAGSFSSSTAFYSEAIAVDGSGNMYMAAYCTGAACSISATGGAIYKFAAGASGGSVIPQSTITGLYNPAGMAFDSSGDLWIADYYGHTVYEFAPGANGAATPLATITYTPTSGGFAPYGVAIDSNGRIIVGDYNGTIYVFAKGSSGSSTPTQTITGLQSVFGIALDKFNNIWVSDGIAGKIYRFASNASGSMTGTAAPIATIAGSSTTLSEPVGIAIH